MAATALAVVPVLSLLPSAVAGPVCPEVPIACPALGPKPVGKAGGGGWLESPPCLAAERVPGTLPEGAGIGQAQEEVGGQSVSKGRQWGPCRVQEELG